MNFLCRLGSHRWKKISSSSQFSSNVIEYRYRCDRCGAEKKEVRPKKQG
ncbi:hypothetical protein J2741_000993 [Methanolinea mesophila]|nr:hypothetical protein [Methanolinea mesophila]MBP1928446.1 hypothetical protein [Methanolinea mesophila]